MTEEPKYDDRNFPLHTQAWMDVGKFENSFNPKSGAPNVVGTRVIEPPAKLSHERTTSMDMMKWAELWTVQQHGSNVLYRMEFDVKGSQGEFVIVIYSGAATNEHGASPRR